MKQTRRLVHWLLLVMGLSLLLATSATAQREGTLEIETETPQVDFGVSIRFALQATSTADITSVVLAYETPYNRASTVQRLDFAPAHELDLSHTVDLAQQPLKPFVQIRYWWTVSDAEGQKVTSQADVFTYEDTRFGEWQSLAGQNVVVHWYSGGDDLGIRAADVANRAVDDIRQMVAPSLALAAPFDLYLYASEQDLALALPTTGREWTVGQAYPELRLAVLAVPPGLSSSATMHALLPHELTHLLLYEALDSRYANLPVWLNEGLAVVSEQSPNPDYDVILQQALQENGLLPFDSLCRTFPREDASVRLAYAQSGSLVRFITDTYGRSAIASLVTVYDDGVTCRGGVEKVLGISLGRLEDRWRASLSADSPAILGFERAAPWLLLILISLPWLPLLALPLTHLRREK
ncbi:MAG: peptidase MA family metallohydrolase [Chloroflexota bacterium]